MNPVSSGNKAATAVYEFRMNAEDTDVAQVRALLKGIAKKYVFQEENSDTGYHHYQGRMSLIKKRRKGELLKLFETLGRSAPNYLEPTATCNFTDEAFYCQKEDTRIAGPFTDKDEKKEVYIPRQYRGLVEKLYPFQKVIFDSCDIFEPRIINLIYDPLGCAGKSTVAAICELYGRAIDMPPVNDADKLIQSACDICVARQIRDPSPVFIDLPRAMNKDRLNGIYTAIEQIKKGKLYDLRYTYKDWWIDSPQIWVFSNIEPDLSMLSKDRWRIWSISKEKELIKYSELKYLHNI